MLAVVTDLGEVGHVSKWCTLALLEAKFTVASCSIWPPGGLALLATSSESVSKVTAEDTEVVTSCKAATSLDVGPGASWNSFWSMLLFSMSSSAMLSVNVTEFSSGSRFYFSSSSQVIIIFVFPTRLTSKHCAQLSCWLWESHFNFHLKDFSLHTKVTWTHQKVGFSFEFYCYVIKPDSDEDFLAWTENEAELDVEIWLGLTRLYFCLLCSKSLSRKKYIQNSSLDSLTTKQALTKRNYILQLQLNWGLLWSLT